MSSRIEWVRQSCRLLKAITAEFAETRPFAGRTIATGIHLEPKTVALLLTLQAGAARVVATGNLNSTQPSTVDYLAAHGIDVIGEHTTDAGDHDRQLRAVLAHEPDLILDNGGDLFARYLDNPYAGLLGGTEETTSGRMRLAAYRAELARPVLVINDSPIKQFAENKHAVGQSVFESYMRITNRATNGRSVAVFGYGACGKGVAANFRNACSTVAVVEVDPVARLEARFDGFAVPSRMAALAGADIVVTVTGTPNVITPDDLDHLKDDVVLMNAGHFPTEIDVEGIATDARVRETHDVTKGIRTLVLSDGRRVHLLTGGHMVNLGGPRPLGNSIESMDIGFALQARCLEAIALGKVAADAVVVPVPRSIDEAVAQAYLDLS
jgi:adenosylhomocysteinase